MTERQAFFVVTTSFLTLVVFIFLQVFGVIQKSIHLFPAELSVLVLIVVVSYFFRFNRS